jgi:hypothetical protein
VGIRVKQEGEMSVSVFLAFNIVSVIWVGIYRL